MKFKQHANLGFIRTWQDIDIHGMTAAWSPELKGTTYEIGHEMKCEHNAAQQHCKLISDSQLRLKIKSTW